MRSKPPHLRVASSQGSTGHRPASHDASPAQATNGAHARGALADSANGHGASANGEASEGKRTQFLINKQSAVPLHIQLKEQVRYAIMSGHYEAGHALPSIRELTHQLGIHRNTVHRVYLELQASGLLVSKPGKGVFVSDSLSDAISMKEVDAIEGLIDQYFQKANKLGINPVTLAALVAQRAPGYDARQPTVGFVECTAHQSSEFARDLSEHFGVTVQQVLLDDLRNGKIKPGPHLRHFVTSLFHFDELRDLMGRREVRVHPVTYDVHPATRKTLREVAPGRRLGFVCHDANTEEVVGAEIKERVAEGVLLGCANLEAPEHALKLISKVDTVVFTEAAQGFCIKNCTPDHELIELHFALNPASVEKVGKVIRFQP